MEEEITFSVIVNAIEDCSRDEDVLVYGDKFTTRACRRDRIVSKITMGRRGHKMLLGQTYFIDDFFFRNQNGHIHVTFRCCVFEIERYASLKRFHTILSNAFSINYKPETR